MTLTLALLSTQQALTSKQFKQYDQQSLHVPLRKFTGFGTPKWHAQLLHLHGDCASFFDHIKANFLSLFTPERFTCCSFVCPLGHNRDATAPPFDTQQPKKT
eukprot:6296827-Karenia_brevis.AAC.1